MTVYTPKTMDADPDERTDATEADRNTQNPMTTEHDDRRRRRNRPDRNRSMGSVSHTNPVTGEPFGESQVFTRGRTIVADGGEPEATEDDETADGDDVARVKDMDHTPREGAPDASAVYERGGEGEMDEDDETEDVVGVDGDEK